MSKRLTIQEWEKRIKVINPDMDLLTKELGEMSKTQTLVVHCNKCGATIERSVRTLSHWYNEYKNYDDKRWCPCCSGQEVFEGINDLATKRPDLMKYLTYKEDGKKYTQKSNAKISTTCPDCGNQKYIRVHNLTSQNYSCKMCKDSISYPNKICRELLKVLPVGEFDTEYYDDWSMGKMYDGYFKLNKRKYLLEFDGLQHYEESNSMWRTLDWEIENDNLKDKLAKENNYILIRIDCRHSTFEYIKNQIYQSKLSELFNLDEIDWETIEKSSLNNKFIQIINYYKEHSNEYGIDIAKVFNVRDHTVYKYLKRADAMGLIKYDTKKPADIVRERRSEVFRRASKRVYSIYDSQMKLVKEFFLLADCARYLDELHPDKNYDKTSIGNSIKTNKPYKGYYFKVRKRINT